MAQQTYTELQPLEGDGKTFAGPMVDNAGTNEFVAQAGANRRAQGSDGAIVADASVHVTQLSGMGAAFGATGDSAASSDTGTFTFLSLFKRSLQTLTSIKDWVAMIGATDDGEAAPGGAGSISGKLRNLAMNLYFVHEAFGDYEDLAADATTAATAMARLRKLSALFEAVLPASRGQKAMAASLPVVLPSDQTAIPASQSGAWDIRNITGSVSLPAGAATETTLGAINTKLGAALPLPTGASTAANQSALNTLVGAVTETPPGTDTASSGTNGRLQRLAQRLSTLIGVMQPATAGAYGDAIPVTTAAGGTLIVAPNTGRKRVSVVNNTSQRIWLGFDTSLTAGPTGHNIGSIGLYEAWKDDYTGPVYGITDTGIASAVYAEMS